MKRNNLKKILIIFMILCLFSLSGCSALFNFEKSEEKTSEETDSNTINAKYGLDVNEVISYDNIDDTDIATVISNLVMPATVEIKCTVNFSYSNLYGGWFGGYSQRTITDQQSCQATGFFINEDGYLLTNAHVVTIENESSYRDLVYNSWDISINFADSAVTFPVKVIAYDVDLDLAILKCDSEIENLKYVTFFNLTPHDSEIYNTETAVKLYYGEYCVAIGNANGYGISVTTGVVSAPYRVFNDDGIITEAIQTDAAINSGNSGGPLCNKYGAVIGINSFKIASSSTDNLGFAIPANVVINYIEKVNTDNSLSIKYYVTSQRSYKK